MARCLVVYDIGSDRLRTKVAEMCLDYGLSRIQLSAFLGPLSRTHQDELMQRARRRLGRSPGYIAIFPVCDADFRGRREVEVLPALLPGDSVTAPASALARAG